MNLGQKKKKLAFVIFCMFEGDGLRGLTSCPESGQDPPTCNLKSDLNSFS